jgi:ATP-dependent RNA helicase DDX51/DBP6
VIDEADRLLAQSFQDWLAQVLAATRPPPHADDSGLAGTPSLPYSDAYAPAFLPLLQSPYSEKMEYSCQKLLFSATLTRDPGKIAALGLRNPKYFVVGANKTGDGVEEGVMNFVMEKFTMPATLTVRSSCLPASRSLKSCLQEHMMICESSQKPLVLFHLVHSRNVRHALVFTKSADSTTRLVQLFELFEQARLRDVGENDYQPLSVRAYSSDLAAGERKSILDKFKAQEIQMYFLFLVFVC